MESNKSSIYWYIDKIGKLNILKVSKKDTTWKSKHGKYSFNDKI